MAFGPILSRELKIAARGARAYASRCVLASLFLLALGGNYYGWQAWNEGKWTTSQLTSLAQTMFCSLAALQGILTLVMIPNQVAGSIAEEKERKTLHYLLASDLSSWEIITDKLISRLWQFFLGITATVPVMSLLTLLGGVDPAWVGLVYLGTLTMAYFLAGLSILASTLARRPRTAVNITVGIASAWITLPICMFVLRMMGWIPGWLGPVIDFNDDWIFRSNPLYLAFNGRSLVAIGPSEILLTIAHMSALQLAYGSICVILAIFALRPVFRLQQGAAERTRSRRAGRAECGDDPMIWKERYPARSGRWMNLIKRGFGICVIVGLGISVASMALPILRESWFPAHAPYWLEVRRRWFCTYLRIMTAFFSSLYIVLASSAGACSVTNERERDTWDGLMCTPMSNRAILRAKMLGAAWQHRWLLVTLGVLWLVGLVTGSLHPVSVLLVMIEIAVFTWFTVALAITMSLIAKNTSQASSATGAVLMLGNMASLLIVAALREQTVLGWATCMPLIEALSLVGWQDVRDFLGPDPTSFLGRRYIADESRGWAVAALMIALLLYGLAAAGLTWAAAKWFDWAVGRPRHRPETQTDCSDGSEIPAHPHLVCDAGATQQIDLNPST
jgi:ABC-type transport system involved in multi-copper enzyme maturation permease subunit